MTTFDNALEAWLKWKRVGEGLGEVLGSSPSGDKKFTYQKKKILHAVFFYACQ